MENTRNRLPNASLAATAQAGYYSHSHFGTESVYRYNRLVLAELDGDALLANENPMGILQKP
jgi:hypothetical protein